MAPKSNTLKSSKDFGKGVAKTNNSTSKSFMGGKKQTTESSSVSKSKIANSLPVKYSEKSRLKKDPDFDALSLEELKVRFKLENFEVKEALEEDMTKDTSQEMLCYATHLKFGLEIPVPSTIARLSEIWKVPIRQMHLSWFFCFSRAKRISEVYGVRYGVYEIYHSCNMKRGKNDFHMSPSFKRKYALTGFPTNYEDWDSRPLRIKGTLVNPFISVQLPPDPREHLALKRADAETVRNLNYIFESRRDKRLFDVHYADEIVEYIYQNDPHKTLPVVTVEELLEDEVVEDTQDAKYNEDGRHHIVTKMDILCGTNDIPSEGSRDTDNSEDINVITAIPVSVAQDYPTLLALNEANTESSVKRTREEGLEETRRVQTRLSEELVQGLGIMLAKAKDLQNRTAMKVAVEEVISHNNDVVIDEDRDVMKGIRLQLESKDEEIKQLKVLLEREKKEVAQRDARMQGEQGKERARRLAAEDECSRLKKLIGSLENDLGVYVVKNSARAADCAHVKEKLEYTTQQYRELYNGVKERIEIPAYFPEPPEEGKFLAKPRECVHERENNIS